MATGGIYGFLSILPRIHQRYGRPRLIIAWEGKKNFRLELYPKYKGRDVEPTPERAELNEELWEQERHLIHFLSVLGVEQYRGIGCEADDVMGRLARETPGNVLIYSGDSDMRQLVDERVYVAAPGKKTDVLYDIKQVVTQHGVIPIQIAALKALSGDSSDKIPGVRGIGPVAAVKLLNHYGTLKRTLLAAEYEMDDWPLTTRHLQMVKSQTKEARLYFQLTKIRTDLGMEEAAKPRVPEQKKVLELIRRYRFRSLESPADLQQLMALGRKP